MTPPPARETVRLAAAGVSSHLLWQLSARLASFAIRAVVVRALGPAQFAFVEIRLTLLVNLVLLPLVAAFRKVCLRTAHPASAAALSYVCVAVTLALALAFGALSCALDPAHTPAWLVITVALVIRAFAEPAVVFARRRERYVQSSQARAACVVISGVAHTVAVALITSPRLASAAGAMGHLFYAVCLNVSMYFAAGPEGIPVLSVKQFVAFLRRDDLIMTGVNLGEGALRFLLENGESIVLDITCSAPIKGAYKLSANVASMLARFFSEALEEQSFNVFHRLAPAFRSSEAPGSTEDRRQALEREKDMRETCVSALNMALKAAITVSVLIALVGPAYSYSLLRLLYGEKWADRTAAPSILNKYFVYLVFMAGNGVTEAFVTAAASTSELKARTKFATFLSAAYMIALYSSALYLDATGIIVVNCLNMTVRTCYSLWFYRHLTGNSLLSLKSALPHSGVIATLCFARFLSLWSETYFMGDGFEKLPLPPQYDLFGRILLHGMSGVLALVMFSASLTVFETGFVRQLRSLRSHQD